MSIVLPRSDSWKKEVENFFLLITTVLHNLNLLVKYLGENMYHVTIKNKGKK